MYTQLLCLFCLVFSVADYCLAAKLEGKVAIVVGASQGIGKATAIEFAKAGARVVLVARNEEKLMQAVEEIRKVGGTAFHIVGDITSQADMDRMARETARRLGRIDILCQNAGIFPSARLEDMPDALWDKVLDTNLTGTFRAVKAVIPYMKEQSYGRIVLTSSISGPQVGIPGQCHYTASKAGLTGFMRTAAIELAKHRITINAVEPGLILTEGLMHLPPEKLEKYRKAIPLDRFGSPADVALAHVFLASDDAGFITGQSLVVDGGQVLPESHYLTY